MSLFIVNTNMSTNKRYDQEMIDEQKCAAYRSTKEHIEYIKKDDKVLLYRNDEGIIARGVADGIVKKKEDNGEKDAEFYMALNEFYTFAIPISYKKIRTIIEKADPSFARPFNVTSLKFSSSASQEIWNEINRYV